MSYFALKGPGTTQVRFGKWNFVLTKKPPAEKVNVTAQRTAATVLMVTHHELLRADLKLHLPFAVRVNEQAKPSNEVIVSVRSRQNYKVGNEIGVVVMTAQGKGISGDPVLLSVEIV